MGKPPAGDVGRGRDDLAARVSHTGSDPAFCPATGALQRTAIRPRGAARGRRPCTRITATISIEQHSRIDALEQRRRR
jgi:hypothetical protein